MNRNEHALFYRIFVVSERGFGASFALILIFLFLAFGIYHAAVLPNDEAIDPELYLEFDQARMVPQNILFELKIKEYEVDFEEDDIYEQIPHEEKPKPPEEEKEPEPTEEPQQMTDLSQTEAPPSNYEPEYLDLLYTKIANNRYYPDICVEKNQQGIVAVIFTIEKDGSIRDLEIYEESEYKYLNQAALKTIEDSVPFPPLQDREEWTLIVDVVFEIF